MWSGNFKTAWISLNQSRWRTFFTMFGIIIGITSVVTIVSLGEGLKKQVVGQIDQLGSNVLTVRPGKYTNAHGGGLSSLNLYSFLAPSTLTTKDVASIKGLPSVKNVAPIEFLTNSASSDGSKVDNIFVAGTSSNLGEILRQKISYGAYFTEDDLSQNFAIIGSDIATRLFGELNPVGATLRLNGQDFIVHGVLSPATGSLLSVSQADINTSIFVPVAAADSLSGGHPNILQIFVQLKSGANIDTAIAQINKQIASNHGGNDDFSVLKQNELLGVSDQVVNSVASFLAGIAAISLLVGGIGIMNIMLVSVTERTREIGIRKAVGATNRQILNHFLVEGLVISVAGGVIGIAVSLLINLLLRIYSNWEPAISIPILVLAVGVSIVTGIIFSLAPALKAARKNPIDALRGE